MVDQTDTDFETFITLPENADRRFELINGKIIEKMPTQLHAFIVSMLSGFLFVYLRQNRIGYALVEARYSLPDDDENDRIPELSFVSKDKAPLVKTGLAPYMPDLAVEVQSPGQTAAMLREKAAYYLANGTRLVWLIYPPKKQVEVVTVAGSQTITDTLTGDDVLPGFSVEVAVLFDDTLD